MPWRASFGRIGASLSVAEHKCGDAVAKLPPELKNHVATDRHTNNGRTLHSGGSHYTSNVAGMFRHGCWSFAQAGVPVAPQVRHDQAVARR